MPRKASVATKATIKALMAAALMLLAMLPALLGCTSQRLVDQNDAQMSAIVESIQANFAEEGWVYTGYEVVETDEEHDTATVSIAYDVVGDARDLLEKHASEKLKDPAAYKLAENINVKAAVELSAFDKGNDALGASLISTQWLVGDTEADAWIQAQNKNG